MRKTLDQYIDEAMTTKAPRKKPHRLEDGIHLSVAKYLRAVIGREGQTSETGVLWYSVETRGRRSLREGSANKSRGCIKGVPDISVFHSGRAYWIELKSDKGTLSLEQATLHTQAKLAGVSAAVCRSIDDVRDVLSAWLIPTREAA